MLRTQKSKLMEELESEILSENPNHMDDTIIDAMFVPHLRKEQPATFVIIARIMLIKTLAQKERIYTLYLTKSFHLQSKIVNTLRRLQF